jgi:hypothetical protein
MSSHIALMGEAKAIGTLLKSGWRPKRTLVYFSWDAEEPMLLGSTEWAETHAAELKQKGLVYINTDGHGRGFLGVEGSHSLQHLVNQVAAGRSETNVPVATRLRARMQVAARRRAPMGAREAEDRARSHEGLPIGALGSGRTTAVLAARHRGAVSAMAAKIRRAASTIRHTTRTSITAASSIRVLSIPAWSRRQSGGWCCAWPTPMFRRCAMAISPIRSDVMSMR